MPPSRKTSSGRQTRAPARIAAAVQPASPATRPGRKKAKPASQAPAQQATATLQDQMAIMIQQQVQTATAEMRQLVADLARPQQDAGHETPPTPTAPTAPTAIAVPVQPLPAPSSEGVALGPTTSQGLGVQAASDMPGITVAAGPSSATPHAQVLGAPLELLSVKDRSLLSAVPGMSFDLQDMIELKVKEQIWADKFINFASLIHQPNQNQMLVAKITEDSALEGQPILIPSTTHKKVKTFEEWMQAFLIFVSVYTAKHQNQTAALMKYAHTILQLSNSGGNWRYYDECFRKLRPINGWSWAMFQGELWQTAMTNASSPLHVGSQKQPFRGGAKGIGSPDQPPEIDRSRPDIVINFTRGKNVLPTADFPTYVGNARVPTRVAVAQSLPLQLPRAPESPQPETSRLPGRWLSPVDPQVLHQALEGYDSGKREFLVQGFTQGFNIPFSGNLPATHANNLKSALAFPEVVRDKIRAELDNNRIEGPFNHPPFHNLVISPIGIVPKKNGNFRMIHHLSYPEGNSINDGIAPEHSSVAYATLDEAIKILKSLPPGSFLAKTDIESAFRIIPIHPSCYHLLGFTFQSHFYFDKRLPMGLSASCQLFEQFSSALEWIANNKIHIQHMIHVLDDFLIIASSEHLAQTSLDMFILWAEMLGVPISQTKTFNPSNVMSFLGIELDTVLQEARLPVDKLQRARFLVSELARKKKVQLKNLQQVIGFLNFACLVVPPGRPFLRRLIDLTRGARNPSHWIRLTKEARLDLGAWALFLESFNGKSFFLDSDWITNAELHLFTDASKTLGFGALFGTSWFYGEWPERWQHLEILVKELFPILAALVTWGHRLSNKKIVVHTDNLALVYILRNATSKEPMTMCLVRKVVLTCLQHNIVFYPIHIMGSVNVLADLLSRLKFQEFRAKAPWADLVMTALNPQIQPENWSP